jgi:dihydropteroate synthase
MSLTWQCRGHRFEIGTRPLVMGIVNVTPDSFSDGGRYLDPAAAVEHGLKLVAEGAEILDIGGESTRPGSQPVPLDEELRRVLPVVSGLAAKTNVPLSVDTNKAEVARQTLDAGASIINDVTGLRGDPDMPRVAAMYQAGVIVMHMQGTPATMQANPTYADVVREVREFFEERLQALKAAGIAEAAISFDPGIGFGKTQDHNLDLLANLDVFLPLNRPLVLGVSRKGTIGVIVDRPRPERMPGSIATACVAAARGGVHVIRAHDVGPTRDAVRMIDAIARHRR